MSNDSLQEQIIAQYQKDEGMMVLVFAQWCVNNNLDPQKVYIEAYPTQQNNPILQQMVELTVPKEESSLIENETLLAVLSLFGNDDLAQVVASKMKL